MSDLNVTITYGSTLNKMAEPVSFNTAPAEFDRFKDLAAKLVQVPKTELDEKLKES